MTLPEKIFKYTVAFCGFVAVLFMTSCVTDPADRSGNGNAADVRILLSMEQPRMGQTRSDVSGEAGGLNLSMGGIPATRTVSESREVNDLWVIQFGTSGGNLLAEPVYVTGTDNIVPQGNDTYGVKVSLSSSLASTIYFIANTGDNSKFSGVTSLSTFKGIVETAADEAGLEAFANVFAGTYEGLVSSSADITADIGRIVAKISLSVSYGDILAADGGTLNLTQTAIKKAGNKVSYYDYLPDGALFPEAAAGNHTDYGTIYGDPRDNVPVWYVAENIRGVNASVTDEKDKWRGNDPSWDGSTSYATHVVMEGTYTEPAAANPQRTGHVVITLYPGGVSDSGDNIKNNYNIVRNGFYGMTANISNFAPDDKRIEVSYDPFVTYEYYYEVEPDASNPDGYVHFGTKYDTNVVENDPVMVNTEILNAFRDAIPVAGDFLDGRPDGSAPTSVSADNAGNVVKIYYDKESVVLTGNVTFYCRLFTTYGTTTNIEPPRTATFPAGTEVTYMDIPEGFNSTLTYNSVPHNFLYSTPASATVTAGGNYYIYLYYTSGATVPVTVNYYEISGGVQTTDKVVGSRTLDWALNTSLSSSVLTSTGYLPATLTGDDGEDYVYRSVSPTSQTIDGEGKEFNAYYEKALLKDVEVRYVLYTQVGTDPGDGQPVMQVDYGNPIGTYTFQKKEGYYCIPGVDYQLTYSDSYGSPLPAGYLALGILDEYNGLGSGGKVSSTDSRNFIYVILYPEGKVLTPVFSNIYSETGGNEAMLMYLRPMITSHVSYGAIGDRYYPDPNAVAEYEHWGYDVPLMIPDRAYIEGKWRVVIYDFPRGVHTLDDYIIIVPGGDDINNLNTIGFFKWTRLT